MQNYYPTTTNKKYSISQKILRSCQITTPNKLLPYPKNTRIRQNYYPPKILKHYPITKKIPKPLVKINNITLLENSINFLNSIGVKHIVINTHFRHKQISDFIRKKKFSSKKIAIF